MKKLVLLSFVLLTQSQILFAQSLELNLPSFDENGLSNFLTSTVLQSVIFVVTGVAAVMALFYLFGNLRMAYDTNPANNDYSSRFPSPTDAGMNLHHGAFGEYVPHFIPIDHKAEEEEDVREDTKGQRGD